MPENLTSAAKIGDLDAVKSCIEVRGIKVDSRFPKQEGPTALYWACCNGFSEIGTYLLKNGADPNIVLPKSGSTPLHAASDRGHYSCVRLLLNSGSRINQQTTNNNDTPLHLVAYRGHSTVCSLLLDKGADITFLNKQGRTALDEAYIQEHQQVIGILSLKHLEIYRSLKVESPKIECVSTSQEFEDRIGIHPFSSEYNKNNKNYKQMKNSKSEKQNIHDKNNKNEKNLNFQSNYSFLNFLPSTQIPKAQLFTKSSHLPLFNHLHSSPPRNQQLFQRRPGIEVKQTPSTTKYKCGQKVDVSDKNNYDGDDDENSEDEGGDKDDVEKKEKDIKNKSHLSHYNFQNNKFLSSITSQINLTNTTNPHFSSTYNSITSTPFTSSSGTHPTASLDSSKKSLIEKIEDLERLVNDLTDAIESKDVKMTALKLENEALKKEFRNKK